MKILIFELHTLHPYRASLQDVLPGMLPINKAEFDGADIIIVRDGTRYITLKDKYERHFGPLDTVTLHRSGYQTSSMHRDVPHAMARMIIGTPKASRNQLI